MEPLKKRERNIVKYSLLNSGDVELNPGRQISYKLLTQMFIRNKRKLKFIHIKRQSLHKKRDNLKQPMDAAGGNTIYGFRETLLCEFDEAKLWDVNENIFRCDRKPDIKERDGAHCWLALNQSIQKRAKI